MVSTVERVVNGSFGEIIMKDVIRDRLLDHRFFQSLDPEALGDIVSKASWYSVAGGAPLYLHGESSNALHFVLAGRLIVVRSGAEGDEVVGYVRAGEPVGEMSMLAGETHSASVFALRDTEILTLKQDDVERIFHEHGEFAGALRPSHSIALASPSRQFSAIGAAHFRARGNVAVGRH